MAVRRYASAREKYRPDRIRVLFIAESPPSSHGYFYFRKTIGKDHLFRETMKALDLWPLTLRMSKGLDKRHYLQEFQRMGFFLIDTCNLPVDKLSREERKLQIARGASSLETRVKRLSPEAIVVVKKTVFRPALVALQAAGLSDKILNDDPIPFPSHGNQSRYRTVLRRLINKIEDS